jgi:radical SAM superfamily enzyme YgiQ (UPF0313 family)
MDLLLTHGYFLHEDAKEQAVMKPYPPLGMLYLCSYLRSRGRSVEVFDSTFTTKADFFQVLQTQPPSVLGVYANLMTRRSVVEMLRAAKHSGWTTIAGGPEPSSYVAEYLDNGADYVVIGEAEETVDELLGALKSKTGLQKVRGVAYRNAEGAVCRTEPRAQMSDIDGLPWPARDAVDIPAYMRLWRQHHGTGSVHLFTSRGCPFACRWCSRPVFGRKHRRRQPALVVDELQWLLAEYQPDMAWIADDVFPIHQPWLAEYTAEIKRRGIRIPFECTSRADRINEETADMLAELGCFRVWMGSESGSQRVLDAMERGVTTEQVHSAVSICRSRGIETGLFLMWGYEGEEMSDIEATVEHIKRTEPDIFFTTVAYPVKDTTYFDSIATKLVNEKEWAQTSDREYRVRGRRTRQYFRYADQLLRSEVELHQLQRRPLALEKARVAELQKSISEARRGLEIASVEAEA